ncbi:unnamed protein product [Cyprideis torosa]|uniref:Uncharacterized protein n=1 Tax=Cyprideis torosa TaxID=163714 RepID=A0A7R8WBD2_9CRUS|nr:unnamed protein product [Cyprideis torosa]CAG0892166.1 unnamed protein product [Cyprideis torosa]
MDVFVFEGDDLMDGDDPMDVFVFQGDDLMDMLPVASGSVGSGSIVSGEVNKENVTKPSKWTGDAEGSSSRMRSSGAAHLRRPAPAETSVSFNGERRALMARIRRGTDGREDDQTPGRNLMAILRSVGPSDRAPVNRVGEEVVAESNPGRYRVRGSVHRGNIQEGHPSVLRQGHDPMDVFVFQGKDPMDVFVFQEDVR